MNDQATSAYAEMGDEAVQLKGIFEKAATAIVDASRFAKEVAALREEVEHLRVEISTVRAQGEHLATLLDATTKERDEARGLLAQRDGELKAEQEAHAVERNSHSATCVELEELHNKHKALSDYHDSALVELDKQRATIEAREATIAEVERKFQELVKAFGQHVESISKVIRPVIEAAPAPIEAPPEPQSWSQASGY